MQKNTAKALAVFLLLVLGFIAWTIYKDAGAPDTGMIGTVSQEPATTTPAEQAETPATVEEQEQEPAPAVIAPEPKPTSTQPPVKKVPYEESICNGTSTITKPTSNRRTAADLVAWTNYQRQCYGLAPLTVDERLVSVATQRAKDMDDREYFSHTTPEGGKAWELYAPAGYTYIRAGENLALDYKTSSEVVDAWLNSPTHRAILLSTSFKDIGIAVSGRVIAQEYGLEQQ